MCSRPINASDRSKMPRITVGKILRVGLFSVIIIGMAWLGLQGFGRLRARIVELQLRSDILNADQVGWWSARYDVLLSSYMNSGSTYTGRLLGFRSDVFFFYEPLWHLTVWYYYKNNQTMCSTTILSCRKIKKEDVNRNTPISGRRPDMTILHDPDLQNTSAYMPLLIPIRILDHVIHCRLLQLRNIIEPKVTSASQFSGPSWEQFRYCMKRRRKLDICLTQLETVCKMAGHRVTKVLRLSVETTETLLKNNPKLQIIHLFRDPRAIIHSRLETEGYPLTLRPEGNLIIRQNAQTLCDKMAADLHEGKQLMRSFPNRFRFIHYEDIYGREHKLLKLHTYLGMQLTRGDMADLLSSSTHFNKLAVSHAGREKEQRKNNAYWWRSYMSLTNAQVVTKICWKVCQELGYSAIQDLSQLRKYNVTELRQLLKYKL